MKKKAFITGINGQDGSYLAELLLEKDYDVYGIVRRNSIAEHQESRINHLEGLVHTEYGDLLDVGSLERLLRTIKPDEIYNIAAQSHVRISMDIPSFTVKDQVPDWKVQSNYWNVEDTQQWRTEDTDNFFYEIEEKKK